MISCSAVGFASQVRDLHRRVLHRRRGDRRLAEADALPGELRDKCFAHAVGSAQRELILRVAMDVDGAGLGTGELRRLGDDRVEHGLEVERRVHRLADLAERTQLFHRLGELAGAQLDLFFQISVGRLKLARHLVELIGKRFELVAGLDRDAARKVAAADPRRPGAQRLDRPDQAQREDERAAHDDDARHGKNRNHRHQAAPECRALRRLVQSNGKRQPSAAPSVEASNSTGLIDVPIACNRRESTVATIGLPS